ncbi:MAG: lipoprotein signal peptidase [Chlorobi bacterium]|nr:lipoprotein signal peptidase [Chlorobiota bacterium]
MSIFKKSLLLVLILLIIDQAIKIYIKLTFNLEEEIPIFGLSWAKIHFTENKGAAFGLLFGGDTGKLILSLFRIVAIIGLIIFLYKISKQKYPKIAIFSIALILTGAIGNILDSAFYGIIFSPSTTHSVATIFPKDGGYAPFLYGSVVDMFSFPIKITVPSWFPNWSWWPWRPDFNNKVSLFPYIFNFADATITIGVALVIIFKNKFQKTS